MKVDLTKIFNSTVEKSLSSFLDYNQLKQNKKFIQENKF